ncbi:hypothetical protein DHEL01_v204474 [Diaporthe helianthi]|uniref:BTB domain-containing protein n=1 Tax=Diaporthe helianthi TaxID=158607 RepID=A0A2P5I3P6_DIAHE|nr:hypothetical protein DHEL01_v204474 [Diaporthe helianthi]
MSSADEDRFRFKDLQLLKTGHYSDAQVTVGDRVWKVHKSIVCQRSSYMRDVLFKSFSDSTPKKLPFCSSERMGELLLEFIYSGRIEKMNDISLADCVKLSKLGRDFSVEGMGEYGANNLWEKLKAKLEIVSLTRTAGGDFKIRHKAKADVLDDTFHSSFHLAVYQAYFLEIDVNCQTILADFVWAARSQLLGTRFLQMLNDLYPRFGSDVLTTLNRGPQSQFLQKYVQHPASTFCTKCAEGKPDSPDQLELELNPVASPD